MFDYTEFDGSAKTAEEAKVHCLAANRILANEGVLDGYGHVSVRNPETKDTFFQARAIAPEFVVPDDILEFSLQGDVISNTRHRVYGERFIHARVLKARPDVQAVFHGHPLEVIALSATGVPFRSLGQFCGMFYKPLPYFDDYSKGSGMLINCIEDGDRLASALGGAPGVILRNHGVMMTGNCVQQMVMNAIFLRDNTRMQLMAAPFGEPRYISEETGRETERTQYSALSLERCWDYWVLRAKKAMPDIIDII